jgi:hypothetical protein
MHTDGNPIKCTKQLNPRTGRHPKKTPQEERSSAKDSRCHPKTEWVSKELKIFFLKKNIRRRENTSAEKWYRWYKVRSDSVIRRHEYYSPLFYKVGYCSVLLPCMFEGAKGISCRYLIITYPPIERKISECCYSIQSYLMVRHMD